MKKKMLFGLLILLVVIQFIRIDKTNPPVNKAIDFATLQSSNTEMTDLVKSACYDCHSNETTYPWYSNVAPFSFLLKSHIKGGRQKVNFSNWGSLDNNKKKYKLEECIEVLVDKRMPMKSYTWMHPKGKLSESQRDELIRWIEGIK